MDLSSWPGRLRGLRAAAREALGEYEVHPLRVRLVADKYNTVFRVETATGAYALRVGVPQRSAVDVRSELAWIEALRRETDLDVVQPVTTRRGEGLVTIERPDVVGERQCVLFRWIEGRGPGAVPSIAAVRRLGHLSARLHEHAATFEPPPHFSRCTWRHAWPPSLLPLLEADHPLLSTTQRHFLVGAVGRVQAVLDDLHSQPAAVRFLHMDLHPWNVKVARGRPVVFDFDDSEWAHPFQDIAISLHSLLWFPNAARLQDAFLSGYTARRPLPDRFERHISALLAARELDMVSTILSGGTVTPSRAARRIDTAEQRLRAWLPDP